MSNVFVCISYEIVLMRRDEQQASEFKALCYMEATVRSDGLANSNSRVLTNLDKFLRAIPVARVLGSAIFEFKNFSRVFPIKLALEPIPLLRQPELS